MASGKRTAVVCAIIRASMERMRARIRWVPGTCMLSDALTKQKGAREILLMLLRCGKYAIIEKHFEELKRNCRRCESLRVCFNRFVLHRDAGTRQERLVDTWCLDRATI